MRTDTHSKHEAHFADKLFMLCSAASSCNPAAADYARLSMRQPLAFDTCPMLLRQRLPLAGPNQADADYVLKESIASLHAAYFAQGPYQSWKAKSNVKLLDRELNRFIKSRSPRTSRHNVAAIGGPENVNGHAAGFTGVADAPDWVLQLAQLSLYFLLWTEAANLRHTPELLWLFYHVMLSSSNFTKVGSAVLTLRLKLCSACRNFRELTVPEAGRMRASTWARCHKATFQRCPCRPICKYLTPRKCKAPFCALLCTLISFLCCLAGMQLAGIHRPVPLLPPALVASWLSNWAQQHGWQRGWQPVLAALSTAKPAVLHGLRWHRCAAASS
jgi:hypothetical protein